MQYRVSVNQLILPSVRFIKALPLGEALAFQAGQYVELLLSDSTTLPFSIANAPQVDSSLSFFLREDKGDSELNRLFAEIDETGLLSLLGPLGDCVYTQNEATDVVFLAAGVGISQCKAIVEQAVAKQDSRRFHLYWNLKSKQDLFLQAALDEWAKQLDFSYQLLFTREGSLKAYQQVLLDFIELSEVTLYLSGPWQLTDEALPELLAHQAKRQKIYSDRFRFY